MRSIPIYRAEYSMYFSNLNVRKASPKPVLVPFDAGTNTGGCERFGTNATSPARR